MRSGRRYRFPVRRTAPTYYQTTASLNRQTLAVDGQEVRLAPGMALTLEVKIGQRRILDYFLSPIMKTTSESIRANP